LEDGCNRFCGNCLLPASHAVGYQMMEDGFRILLQKLKLRRRVYTICRAVAL
jgi:hypothetical protein